jgi:aspartyl-tRNA(Asn)/glutamyl-tRNA(Gln) amidotransferase subunit C
LLQSLGRCGRNKALRHKMGAGFLPNADPLQTHLCNHPFIALKKIMTAESVSTASSTAAAAANSIDLATVTKLARLSRLALTEEEKGVYAAELTNILGWIEQLLSIDVGDVKPMTSVLDQPLRLREDRVTEGDLSQQVLSNAPQASTGFYVTPSVIE